MQNIGCQLDKPDEHGRTALHAAMYLTPHAALEVTRMLLQAGAKVNVTTTREWIPASGAAFGHEFIARWQTEHGDLPAIAQGVTPFMLAVENGSVELAQLLLAAKADISATDKTGASALDRAMHNACLGWQYEPMVRFLIEAGINLETKQIATGQTPLLFAAHTLKSPRLVRLLVQAGADLATADKAGRTPFSPAPSEPLDLVCRASSLLLRPSSILEIATCLTFCLCAVLHWSTYDCARGSGRALLFAKEVQAGREGGNEAARSDCGHHSRFLLRVTQLRVW